MTRRIVLHVGAPKSGSTFLQRAMLRNRALLRDHGIAYPHPGQGHPGNAGGIAAMGTTDFEALFAEGAPTVVLSHENLFATAPEAAALARWARGAGVTIQRLVFLRPWSDFVFGDMSQKMKQNAPRYLATRNPYDGLTLEEIALRRLREVDPVELLMRWSRVIPTPRLVLASHRRIPEVMEDLLGHPGLDWAVPFGETNPSLRIADCEMLAAMMRDPAEPEDRIRAALSAAYGRSGQPDPGRSAERRRWIEALFDGANRELRTVYGYDNRATAA